jgi:hypothetical protein
MKAFNLLTKYENRLTVQMPKNEKNIWVLAGRKENGQAAILVSCFKSPARQIQLNIANVKINPQKCKVSIVDAKHDLQPLGTVQIIGSKITLPKPAGSVVFFVELL